MTRFIDLTQPYYQGMPGFRMKHPQTGVITEYSTKIYPFLTHQQTSPYFQGDVSFEITQFEFQASVGTYLDSPYHRFPNGKDIGSLTLEDVILSGITIDATGLQPHGELNIERIDSIDMFNKAVLFHFGWDQYFGQDQYYQQPFISEEIIDLLIDKKAKLVGVDTINIDSTNNPLRPAHSKLLANDILIVENMRNLGSLPKAEFRFFAVPIPAKQAASVPIRAFAEIT